MLSAWHSKRFERLDRELEAQLLAVGGGCAVGLDQAGALRRGGRLAGKDAERLIERAGQDLAAGGGQAIQ